MKKLIVVFGAMLALVSCSSDDDRKPDEVNPLVGKWVYSNTYVIVDAKDKDIESFIKRDISEQTLDVQYMVFGKNGEYTYFDLPDKKEYEGTYSIKSSDKLEICFGAKDCATSEYTVIASIFKFRRNETIRFQEKYPYGEVKKVEVLEEYHLK